MPRRANPAADANFTSFQPRRSYDAGMSFSIHHALNRFGLGRLGNEKIQVDGRGWALSQLEAEDRLARLPTPNLRDAIAVTLREDRYNEARRRDPNSHPENDPAIGPPQIGAMFHRDLADALSRATLTETPVLEHLVLFWANHVSVSGKAGGYVLAMIGPYVAEAIRPHIRGRFVDLLRACLTHPAMLYYYGADASVGPNSPSGLARHLGLNENLGRETLELFTLGVEGGYSQADVTAAARILTGFSVERTREPLGFRFNAEAHEPGPQTLMGRLFPPGEEGWHQLVEFLGTHPSTYRHIATKLVRHYVNDTPPPHCVARVTARLVATEGHLGEAMREIIALPEAWEPLAKLRTPIEYVLATYRLFGNDPGDGFQLFGDTSQLGGPFWYATLVNGWPDTAADWASGEALLRRVDLAWRLAGRKDAPDAMERADAVLGPLLSANTRSRIAAAPSRRDALALLLSSPEFMRR